MKKSVLLLGPLVAMNAHAEIYMTDVEAARAIFPGKNLERGELELSSQEAEKIEKASGETVRSKKLKIFRDREKNLVFIDQVIGKHEFITLAVGLNKEGKVTGIEILEYRETYGQQVRGEEWRKQFVGKGVSAPLKLESDIKNISGATLSSAHVTAGVRRLIQTYDTIRARI